MTEFDAFMPELRMYAPGVSEPVAQFALRQAAIEFCERTRIWRFEDEFPVTADECDAILAAPSDAAIHEIEATWFDGRLLERATPAQMDERSRDWRSGATTGAGMPRYVTQTAPNTIALIPRGTGTVKVALFLKPSMDAAALPDFLSDQYRERIAHGALARVLLIPGQSFTDPQMAAAFGASFQQKLDGLSTKGSEGQQRARPRVKAMYF